MSLSPDIAAKVERLLELDDALDIHMTLESAGIYPTEEIVNELVEIIGIIGVLEPHAKGDTTELRTLVQHYEEECTKYKKYLKEERDEDGRMQGG